MGEHLALFAGPGGWCMGGRLLGLPAARGFDLDADACATARAAGFRRELADVRRLDPEAFEGVEVVTVSPPCPTLSAGGLRTGTRDGDRAAVVEGLSRLADAQAGLGGDDAYAEVYDQVTDARTGLVVEALRFALRIPGVRVVVAEQVPAAVPFWEEACAELAMVADFEACHVVTVHAEDLGLPSLRRRVFLVAVRDDSPDLSGLPVRRWWTCGRFVAPRLCMPPLAPPVFRFVSMAAALGWPAGERVNTRGNRTTPGGNEFSADQRSWCVTEKARSWKRVRDGAELTAAEAGLLNGFPASYPWQGVRSKQFLQAADVVPPPVAAAVLGAALGLPWEVPVREYLAQLYPAAGGALPVQPSLFEVA